MNITAVVACEKYSADLLTAPDSDMKYLNLWATSVTED